MNWITLRIKKLFNSLYAWSYSKSDHELATAIVRGMVSLELMNGEYIVLAPFRGSYGMKVSGNFRPYFRYDFHTGKEWVNVSVMLSVVDKVGKIRSSVSLDGEPVAMHPSYLKPFYELAHCLTDYFPYTDKSVVRMKEK